MALDSSWDCTQFSRGIQELFLNGRSLKVTPQENKIVPIIGGAGFSASLA